MEHNTENYSIFKKDLIALLERLGERTDSTKTNELLKLIINNKQVYNKESSEIINSQLLIDLISRLIQRKGIVQRKSFLSYFDDNLRYYIDELKANSPEELRKQEMLLQELTNFISFEIEFINIRDDLSAFTDNEEIFLESELYFSTYNFEFDKIQEHLISFERDILKLDYLYWLQKEYRRLLTTNKLQRESLVPLINYVEKNIFRIRTQLNSPENFTLYVNESQDNLKMYLVSKIHYALKKSGIRVNSELFAESFGYQLTRSFKTAYTTKTKKMNEKWENFLKIVNE